MNREVNVTKRIRTDNGLRYCRVVLTSNGRIKPDWVWVGEHEERHSEGAYYLEWYEGSRRRRLSVGNDSAEAHTQRLRKEAELNARNNGITLPPQSHGHRPIADAVRAYLEEVRLSKRSKTYAAYSVALRYFQESCSKLCLEDLERIDLLKFAVFLRDHKEHAPRSCHVKFGFLENAASRVRGTNRGTKKRGISSPQPCLKNPVLDTLNESAYRACKAWLGEANEEDNPSSLDDPELEMQDTAHHGFSLRMRRIAVRPGLTQRRGAFRPTCLRPQA